MKARLASLVACPIDRGSLELVAWEETRVPLSNGDRARAERLGIATESLEREISTGVLVNRRLSLFYPIHAGVPRLLTFPAAVTRTFVETHATRLAAELPGLGLPSEPPMPGEEDVLRTFSNEWVSYDWTGDSYWNLAPDAWMRCMGFMLDLERRPLAGQRVLEVGIGIGGVADHHARQGCELVGMDLGYATDAAERTFGRKNKFLHVVQASVFRPPFPDDSFDFVYSFGVIHHTFSTRDAFDRLARLPRHGGRLFVWVYSPWDEERTFERRMMMRLERLVRPLAWRLPDHLQTALLLPLVPLYMARQKLDALRNGKGRVAYGFREAIHAARDRFTPRFVHRHSDDEVSAWFAQAGYRDLARASEKPRPEFVPIAFTASTGVDGVRA